MTGHPRHLTVAVGLDGADNALRFAVDHARRTGVALDLVHVLYLPGGDPFPPTFREAVGCAQGVLRRAAAEVAELDDTVAVTTELVEEGTVVSTLVERSVTSEAVVIEHRRLSRFRRFVSGSVANGVAARAHVPVVAVPEDWRPAPGDPPMVTVAVQDVTEARGLLADAVTLARQRGARLQLLHAWWMDNGFDTTMEDDHIREWKERTRGRLQEVLDEGDLAGIESSVRIVHRPPAEALIDASVQSDALVVGRRHHLLPLGTHLGPVARGAIEHARCPVVIASEAGR